MNDIRHWTFAKDMNFDGSVTISDVGLWVNWIFTYPGDWVILKLTHTNIGNFFEFSAADYGGVFSFLISMLFFAMIFAIPSTITDGIAEQKEWNESTSPKEKLQARKLWSVMIFTAFSFFLLWISLQLNVFWFEAISGFMVLLGSVLFFTSNRWNKY